MKKKYLLLIIILLFPTLVLASTNTKSREGVDNYGVTKVKVTDSMKEHVLATPYVNASEMIYDFSDIFTDEEEQALFDKISDFRDRTKFDVVILTENLPYSSDDKNELYAADFYDFNDFSKNGIIFFRNTYEDPYYTIVSSGEAQLYYYDTRVDDILDGIYDYVHGEEYVNAVEKLLDYLESYYKKGKLDNYYLDENGYLKKKKNYFAPIAPAVIISGIITAIVISTMVNKNKMIRSATRATSYADRNSIKYTSKKDNLVNSITTSHRIVHDSGGSSGGGHSSFGGHSGIGHSGGGRHG